MLNEIVHAETRPHAGISLIRVCRSIQIRSCPCFVSGVSLSLARRCSASPESISSLDGHGVFQGAAGPTFRQSAQTHQMMRPCRLANDVEICLNLMQVSNPCFNLFVFDYGKDQARNRQNSREKIEDAGSCQDFFAL